MIQDLETWYAFIDQSFKKEETCNTLKKYVKKILLTESPVIFEFTHLSLLLGINKNYLAKIVNKPDIFYHEFSIPKKNGEHRIIHSPNTLLQGVQRWIYLNILSSIKLHENCIGFRKDYNIKHNASKHLNTDVILKMDLKDFFSSIKKRRVISVFRNIGYTRKLSYALASLCCNNNSLPQGAPSSPFLSNIIAKRLDIRLSAFCKKFNLNYTRYADDLTVSGDFISRRMIVYITKIINDEDFIVNENKTRLLYKNNQRIITGISVCSDKLTIPKKKKREIKQSIYFIKKYGLFEHVQRKNISDPIFLERFLGYLYFWKFVEPENKIIETYISLLKKEIKKTSEVYVDLKEKEIQFVGLI
ncbi:retron St85 family RNA-directed DNA polymerase [uncultured Chryseobacterium sp.]|uniref:retron St85 family RNA-directed DNA polymerase n=1 Tax=uncultured Chryseobacterium sp. TaxID=259322 RepID=UPI0025EF6C3C|nr:retron St85 family RNA-directed DNA polymerase [uncultured Chryseobacterium sp.]